MSVNQNQQTVDADHVYVPIRVAVGARVRDEETHTASTTSRPLDTNARKFEERWYWQTGPRWYSTEESSARPVSQLERSGVAVAKCEV